MTHCRNFGRRMDGLWGRRSEERNPIAMAASLFSMLHSRVVLVANISNSGAMLSGSELPSACAEVWIRLGLFDVFGRVVWSGPATCGIKFDKPLSEADTERLEREVLIADGHELSPAYKSWTV